MRSKNLTSIDTSEARKAAMAGMIEDWQRNPSGGSWGLAGPGDGPEHEARHQAGR